MFSLMNVVLHYFWLLFLFSYCLCIISTHALLSCSVSYCLLTVPDPPRPASASATNGHLDRPLALPALLAVLLVQAPLHTIHPLDTLHRSVSTFALLAHV